MVLGIARGQSEFLPLHGVVAFDKEVHDLPGSVVSLIPLTIQRLCSDKRAAGGLNGPKVLARHSCWLRTLLEASQNHTLNI